MFNSWSYKSRVSLSRLCENQPAATQCVKINSTELCSDIKNIYIFFRYATLAFSFFIINLILSVINSDKNSIVKLLKTNLQL